MAWKTCTCAWTTSERIWSTGAVHPKRRWNSCRHISKGQGNFTKSKKRTRFSTTECSWKGYITTLDLCSILNLVYDLAKSTNKPFPFSFNSRALNEFVPFTIGTHIGLHQMAITNYHSGDEGKRSTTPDRVEVFLTTHTNRYPCGIRTGQIANTTRTSKCDSFIKEPGHQNISNCPKPTKHILTSC